jgi:hypothetical protein
MCENNADGGLMKICKPKGCSEFREGGEGKKVSNLNKMKSISYILFWLCSFATQASNSTSNCKKNK